MMPDDEQDSSADHRLDTVGFEASVNMVDGKPVPVVRLIPRWLAEERLRRESQAYGRSPALDALPRIKKEQALDRADLEDGSTEAMERLLARKRLAWAGRV